MSYEIGAKIETEKGEGEVAYYGETEFADGIWVGVILDEPNGKNNGTVKGVKYFECANNHGVFLKASQIQKAVYAATTTEGQTKGNVSGVASNLRAPTKFRTESARAKQSISPVLSPSQSTNRLKDSQTNLSNKRQSMRDDATRITPQKTTPRQQERLRSNRSSSSLLDVKSTFAQRIKGRVVELSTHKVDRKKASDCDMSKEYSRENSITLNASCADSVKAIVKKMEEATLSVPSVLPPGMDESSELEWLRIQHKDLSEKLESLRAKRKEDHTRLVEFERNRIQLEALLEYKAKMTEKHTALQRQLQEKEKELVDALNSREERHEDMTDIEEQLELVTLDKEVAEEKAEILQAELDSQKDRIRELEMELHVLKEEMENASCSSLEGNSVQVKQLEQQNERLREAVVKLRDLTGQWTLEKQDILRENEELKEELTAFVKRCEKLKQDAENAEQMVVELKEQLIEVNERVDVALGSETMIEKLTVKNLDMEERIRSLEESIEDFESMRAMDEEILDAQKEAERELKIELDSACGRINELQAQIKACSVQAEDTEKIIMKFRRKVRDLNEEIQEHKDQILRLEDQLKKADSDVSELNSTNMICGTRTLAEIITSEINSIELEFSGHLIRYLRVFLSDSFVKPGGDNDALIINVLCPRLSRKALLLSKYIIERYPSVPGGMRREHVTKSHKAEQWAHGAKLAYFLKSLERILGKFSSAMQMCSVERLSRIAQLHIDMVSQEKVMDNYIEMLITNRIDENTSSENLEKLIAFFQNCFLSHMTGEAYDIKADLNNMITLLLKGLSWLKVNVERMNYFPIPDSSENEITKFNKSLLAAISECEQLSIRSRNRIPEKNDLLLNADVDNKLTSAIKNLEQIARLMENACAFASTQLTLITDADGLHIDHVKEMLLGAVEKVNGSADFSKTQDHLKNHLTQVCDVLTYLADVLDEGSMEVEYQEKTTYPPLLERAHARKHDAVEAEGLKWQIEKKDSEIFELKKTIRAKTEEISNYRLRLEMADKRIERTDKADESRVQSLETRCEELQSELKKARVEFDETMDALQRDLEATEKENAELREKMKDVKKKATLMVLKDFKFSNLTSTLNRAAESTLLAPTSPLDGCSASHMTFLQSELVEKENALKWASTQIRQLKSQETFKVISGTNVVEVLPDISGPLTLASHQTNRNVELDKLIRQVEHLIVKCRKYQVPFIIDLTKPKKLREVEQRQHSMEVKNINDEKDMMKFRIQRFCAKFCPDGSLPTLFEDMTPIFVAKENKIPSPPTTKGIHSEEYKNAFNKLFGDLDARREALQRSHTGRVVPAVR